METVSKGGGLAQNQASHTFWDMTKGNITILPPITNLHTHKEMFVKNIHDIVLQ